LGEYGEDGPPPASLYCGMGAKYIPIEEIYYIWPSFRSECYDSACTYKCSELWSGWGISTGRLPIKIFAGAELPILNGRGFITPEVAYLHPGDQLSLGVGLTILFPQKTNNK